MLLNFAGSGHPIFRCTSALERGELEKQSKWKEVNTLVWQHPKYWVASPNGHLHQSAQSLRSSSGYDWRITSWSESSRETPLHQVNWIKWRFLHNLFLQKCKPMERDRRTCCKNTSNDLKNCQTTRSYPDYAPKQVWDWSKLDNFSMLFRHQEERKINLYAENVRRFEIKKELPMYDLAQSRTY